MSVPVRSSLRWTAMVFAILAGFSGGAAAQTVVQGHPDSVQTYVNDAMPPDDGTGGSWNHPYKAGQLKLTKPLKDKKKADAILAARPSLPVGQLQAPQMPAEASPPKIALPQTSSASVMLMQGMKNALQKAGQNTDLPKSSLSPLETNAPSVPTDAAPPSLQPPVMGGGQSAPEQQQPADIAPVAASDVATPKATELNQAPMPLDQIGSNPAADAAKAATPSIFGAPVDESAAAKAPDAAPAAEPPAMTAAAPVAETKACDPQVTAWTKTCAEAGYPADFSGQITGETRTECPSGEIRDVWLTNSCAASSSSIAPAPAPAASEAPAAAFGGDVVAATPAPVADEAMRVDASCGAANGLATNGKPAADLCQHGAASDVSGDGPWRWSCKGDHGGMTISCAAAVAAATPVPKDEFRAASASAPVAAIAPAAQDAKCGTADGAGAETAPLDNLCQQGIASRVNGGGPWTWACSGINGGVATSCNAAKKVDGICGGANSAGADSMPKKDLCDAGFASAITGNGPWYWACSGVYGGIASTCSAAPRVNAVCGGATLVGHRESPKDELCNVGQASAVEGEGPWRWSCAGSNGGAQVSCVGPTMVDGVCGGSNGVKLAKAPSDDLCTQGTASRVTGNGPFDWSCSGQDGGSTVSCTAALTTPEAASAAAASSATGNACGSAAEMAAFAAPKDSLCASGKPSAVVGGGPWSWTCNDNDGKSTTCSTLTASEGACGTATNVTAADAPSSDLCAAGAPSPVTKDSKSHWVWDCQGSMGASTVSCTAPVGLSQAAMAAAKAAADARCGPAAGRGSNTAPASELCDNGKPGAVHGKGPWSWACAVKGGAKASCEAPKVVDGQCGAINGSVQNAAPQTGLCNAGTATEISGNGPWLWSCVGAGGGSSVSCSVAAQSQTKVDGTCGAAANAVMTTPPAVNLCDSGMPSNIYGEGPWTWTCSGLNGGIASTCATNKTLPKAPPPPGPVVNGNCGPANGVAAVDQPEDGLCSAGTVTSVSGNGPWNWSCLGANGGMTVSCTAPLVPPAPIVGACGAANGVSTLTTPRSALCAAGIASAVSGKGPWTWSCSGTNGGGAVGCVAPVAGKGASSMPLPSMVTPSDAGEDEAPAPLAAPTGLVTPHLPSGKLQPMESGSVPQLKSTKPLNVTADAVPPPPASLASDLGDVPGSAPNLPAGSDPLTPPPIRDTLSPPPALRSPSIDSEGAPLPGSRLELPSDAGSILFLRDSDAITKDALPAVNKLGALLQAHSDVRITLTAYADNSNITPREARRLSLARALAIRDYLTAKGVSSSRIDVRALGANVSSGEPDRVDVKVN